MLSLQEKSLQDCLYLMSPNVLLPSSLNAIKALFLLFQETNLVKVTKDLHIAKPQGQFLVVLESACSISHTLPPPTAWQIFLSQDTIFSWFFSYFLGHSTLGSLTDSYSQPFNLRVSQGPVFLPLSWGTLQSQGFGTIDMLTCPMLIFPVQISFSLSLSFFSLSPPLPCLLKFRFIYAIIYSTFLLGCLNR